MQEIGRALLETYVVAHDNVERLGLVRLIEDSRLLRLGGIAASAKDAVGELARRSADVVVVSFARGDAIGTEFTAALRQRNLDVPVLLIADETSGDEALKILGSGANGLITASADENEVLEAIQTVVDGRAVVGAGVSAALVPELQRRAHSATMLTERELHILRELAGGGTAQEIAARLHLATPTVKNHVAHIYAKLGVRDRGAAVAQAMRRGWFE